MGIVSDDKDEGLAASLAIYLAAISATVLVVGTPIYLMTRPTHVENPGMSAYQPPSRVRPIPEVRLTADVAFDMRQPKLVATKIARQ
jgi:hypothetical protein